MGGRNETVLEQPEPKGKLQEGMIPLLAVILLAILTAVGTLIFYQYLEDSLFQERNSHITEITDKVTQVIGAAVEHFRSTADTTENLLSEAGLRRAEEIPEALKEIQNCLELEEGVVLAFDSERRFYASDGGTGNWPEAFALSGDREREELVTVLDYQADDAGHILFVKKMDHPTAVGEDRITHVAVAVNITVFQEAFDADVFQGKSHVYVIGSDGDRLYRHVCEGGFIDSVNLLEDMESYEFLHGGTARDLRKSVSERVGSGYEFMYGKERYFVAASPVTYTDWSVLTYVPTEVLGEGMSDFLNTALVYGSSIAVLVVLMMALVMFFVMKKRADGRLIEYQRQVNERLKEDADAANAASVAKTDFLSHMSHDIRTPINGIMGMTEIALKNLDDRDRVLDCLKKIESSSGHLLSLVNDVLDMSRIESGKTKISHEPVSLPEVAGHCAAIIGGQLQGRDVKLVEDFDRLEHPYIFGDELHLRQVLINLLGNAVKFTPDGGTIWFRVKELSAEGDRALFRMEVEDTGIGMKPEFLEHAFEAFTQEDDGNRSRCKGTGLGLAITRQFVDLMGGTIRVESRLNEGSRFTVELSADINREGGETDEEKICDVDLTGLRLLLAEDNELNREIASYMLEDRGIEVVSAMDGREALKIFADSEPGTFDGILMDVMMPVIDGLAATRAIRNLEREDAGSIPIIAMTANAYNEDKRRCLEAGMNAHVAKPIDGAVLTRVLARYIMPRKTEQ